MSPAQQSQRGEGKVGCAVSLVLLVLAVAVSVKVVPVYYSNDRFIDAAEELAGQAGTMPLENLEKSLRNKAKALDIPEALVKGAVTVTVAGEARNGSCTIQLKYTRSVDFFGAYTLAVATDKKVMKAFVDSR